MSNDKLTKALTVAEAQERLTPYYEPDPEEPMTWVEFEARGHALLELARVTGIALGRLALWGWAHFGKGMGTNEWARECARAWGGGCTRTTVIKAMRLAQSPVSLPDDLSDTLNYSILCLSDDHDELEKLFQRAAIEGWTTWDLTEMRRLNKHFNTGWHKPVFEIVDGIKLILHVNGQQATIAWLEDADENLVGAGLELLRMRGKVE